MTALAEVDAAREAGILIPPPKKVERVVLITCHDAKYEALAKIALPNFTAYCIKHGYQLFVGDYHTDPTRLDTYGDRGKIDMFNRHYESHDIVMFLDIDALVMNSDIRIEDRIGAWPFVWTYDVNGPCSGFWIARCTEDVFLMLNTVKNRAPQQGNVRMVYVPGPPAKTVLELEPTGQSDQKTMVSMMNEPPYSNVLRYCVAGNDAGHCYPRDVMKWPEQYPNLNDYAPGDWIVTFPAVPLVNQGGVFDPRNRID